VGKVRKMRRSLSLFGFLLMIAGLGIAAFTAFMALNQATLMEYFPAAQQYFMGAILAIMFIVIGFLVLQE
jgi:uncharacterized membrane protein